MDVSMQIIRSELAPLGRLRVAINLGNPVLAQRAADGALAGVVALLGHAASVPVVRSRSQPSSTAAKPGISSMG